MRILSGIQPTGRPHLGNYFGMMEPAIRLQDEGEALYFIADLHALTTVRDPKLLRTHSRDLAIDFLACGLDPSRATLFRQSDIPEITELSWVLSSVAPMGLLKRCHSYKDKIDKGMEASHGLFSYPVLMAADIVLYDSDLVPVGKDQKQHLEVTRDLVGKINETYGEDTLKLPEARIQEATAAVPGLDGQKMSKSYNNTVPLFGEEKPIRKSVMRIPTDSTSLEDPKSTDDSIILDLYRLVAKPEEIASMVADHEAGGIGYGDFKKRLFEAYWDHFSDFRVKREEIAADPGEVDRILEAAATRAREIAIPVMDRVRRAVGLR